MINDDAILFLEKFNESKISYYKARENLITFLIYNLNSDFNKNYKLEQIEMILWLNDIDLVDYVYKNYIDNLKVSDFD